MISKKTIQRVVDDIVEKCRPRKVILFGSYARGNPQEDSDLDIFVVANWRGSSAHKYRRVSRAISASGFGIDIVVRSPAQVRRSLTGRDWFVQEVFEQGKVLYEL